MSDPLKKPGAFDRILRALEDTLRCIRIAFDIIRLLQVGYV